ncbi:MAG: FAD-dependent oxidoreductase, partial [Actinobacteria bacterium]|nr:FAD-dependent oxidoreductase [Actinomycetota bacterium]
DPSWLEPLHPEVPALRGEVFLAVEREMALTLVDFMDRRAALLLFSPNFGLAGAEAAAEIMAELLGWDADRTASELVQYRELAAEHTLPSE